MKKTTKTKPKYPACAPDGSNWLFSKTYPPIECEVAGWLRRTSSPIYRRRIKRAVQMVDTYRLMGGGPKVSRQDVDACHRLLDTLSFDASRSLKRDRKAEPLMGDGQGETNEPN